MVKQKRLPSLGSLSSTMTPRSGSCPWTLNWSKGPDVRLVYSKTSENCKDGEQNQINQFSVQTLPVAHQNQKPNQNQANQVNQVDCGTIWCSNRSTRTDDKRIGGYATRKNMRCWKPFLDSFRRHPSRRNWRLGLTTLSMPTRSRCNSTSLTKFSCFQQEIGQSRCVVGIWHASSGLIRS